MADTALTQLGYTGGGPGPSTGGGLGSAVSAPINALGNVANASTHLTLLGTIAFLVLLWGLIRMAGFRFGVKVATGVGR